MRSQALDSANHIVGRYGQHQFFFRHGAVFATQLPQRYGGLQTPQIRLSGKGLARC
jgi:hypothetical protein